MFSKITDNGESDGESHSRAHRSSLSDESTNTMLKTSDDNSTKLPSSTISSSSSVENNLVSVCSPETRTGLPLNMTIQNLYSGKISIYLVDSKCNPVFYYTLPPFIASRQLTWRNYMWYATDNETGTTIDRFVPLTPWSVDWIIRDPAGTIPRTNNTNNLASSTSSGVSNPVETNAKVPNTFLRADEQQTRSQEVRQTGPSNALIIAVGTVILVSGIVLCASFLILISRRWRRSGRTAPVSPKRDNDPDTAKAPRSRPPSLFEMSDEMKGESTVGAYFLKAKVNTDSWREPRPLAKPINLPTRSIVHSQCESPSLPRFESSRFQDVKDADQEITDLASMRTFFSWLKKPELAANRGSSQLDLEQNIQPPGSSRRSSLMAKLPLRVRQTCLSPVLEMPDTAMTTAQSFSENIDVLVIERTYPIKEMELEHQQDRDVPHGKTPSPSHFAKEKPLPLVFKPRDERMASSHIESPDMVIIAEDCEHHSAVSTPRLWSEEHSPASTTSDTNADFVEHHADHSSRMSCLDTPVGAPTIPFLHGRGNTRPMSIRYKTAIKKPNWANSSKAAASNKKQSLIRRSILGVSSLRNSFRSSMKTPARTSLLRRSIIGANKRKLPSHGHTLSSDENIGSFSKGFGIPALRAVMDSFIEENFREESFSPRIQDVSSQAALCESPELLSHHIPTQSVVQYEPNTPLDIFHENVSPVMQSENSSTHYTHTENMPVFSRPWRHIGKVSSTLDTPSEFTFPVHEFDGAPENTSGRF